MRTFQLGLLLSLVLARSAFADFKSGKMYHFYPHLDSKTKNWENTFQGIMPLDDGRGVGIVFRKRLLKIALLAGTSETSPVLNESEVNTMSIGGPCRYELAAVTTGTETYVFFGQREGGAGGPGTTNIFYLTGDKLEEVLPLWFDGMLVPTNGAGFKAQTAFYWNIWNPDAPAYYRLQGGSASLDVSMTSESYAKFFSQNGVHNFDIQSLERSISVGSIPSSSSALDEFSSAWMTLRMLDMLLDIFGKKVSAAVISDARKLDVINSDIAFRNSVLARAYALEGNFGYALQRPSEAMTVQLVRDGELDQAKVIYERLGKKSMSELVTRDLDRRQSAGQ